MAAETRTDLELRHQIGVIKTMVIALGGSSVGYGQAQDGQRRR